MKSFKNYLLEAKYNKDAHIKSTYAKLFKAMSGLNSTGRNHYLNPHKEYLPHIMTNYEEGYEHKTDSDNPQENKITWNNYHEAAHKIAGVDHMNEMFGLVNNTSEHRGSIWSIHSEMLDNLTQNKLHPHYDSKISSLYKTIKNKFGHDEDDINKKLLVNLFSPHHAYFNSVLPRNTPIRMNTIQSVMDHHVNLLGDHHDKAYIESFHPLIQHPDFDKSAPILSKQDK